jgi:acyl carrier protein
MPDPMADDRARVLSDYICGRLLADRSRTVDIDTKLVGDGMLDSMGIVILAAFIEERFGRRVDDADIRAGELQTIGSILSLLDRRA